jgi:hypothetical protein
VGGGERAGALVAARRGYQSRGMEGPYGIWDVRRDPLVASGITDIGAETARTVAAWTGLLVQARGSPASFLTDGGVREDERFGLEASN